MDAIVFLPAVPLVALIGVLLAARPPEPYCTRCYRRDCPAAADHFRDCLEELEGEK